MRALLLPMVSITPQLTFGMPARAHSYACYLFSAPALTLLADVQVHVVPPGRPEVGVRRPVLAGAWSELLVSLCVCVVCVCVCVCVALLFTDMTFCVKGSHLFHAPLLSHFPCCAMRGMEKVPFRDAQNHRGQLGIDSEPMIGKAPQSQ